jgi:hypothetical protein
VDEGVAFGSVNAHIARVYHLPPLMLSHYEAASALRQKIGALAGRREVQARDVFDVHHLIAGGAAPAGGLGLKPEVVERACSNAMVVDFAMFKGQVLAYLEPDDQARFDSASVWDTIVLEVVEALRGYSS